MKNLSLLIIGMFIGALVTYFYCCYQNPEEGIIIPSGVITPKEANILDQTFNTRHQLISDSIVKRPDNRSSWYSLVDMRNYLDYAEKQTKDLGYTMDGIRVYLGAYPDVNNQVGYTTMFLVPTGYQVIPEANVMFFNTSINKGGDIPGGDGLNDGGLGDPPSANYPQ